MRLSRKQQKFVDDAKQAVLEKPKRRTVTRKPRAEKGTTIPDGVWLNDPVQGCVYVIQGKVLAIDVDMATGKVTQLMWSWAEYQEKVKARGDK